MMPPIQGFWEWTFTIIVRFLMGLGLYTFIAWQFDLDLGSPVVRTGAAVSSIVIWATNPARVKKP